MQGFDVFFAGQAFEEIDKLPVILYAMIRMYCDYDIASLLYVSDTDCQLLCIDIGQLTRKLIIMELDMSFIKTSYSWVGTGYPDDVIFGSK